MLSKARESGMSDEDIAYVEEDQLTLNSVVN